MSSMRMTVRLEKTWEYGGLMMRRSEERKKSIRIENIMKSSDLVALIDKTEEKMMTLIITKGIYHLLT